MRLFRRTRLRLASGRLRARFDSGELLAPCTGYWGEADVEERDPAVAICRGAIYVPRRPGLGSENDVTWGLYEGTGRIIDEATYRRGPGPERVGMAESTSLRAEQIARAPDCLYVYVGLLHTHYGHFLLSGLARFWPRLSASSGSVRLLYHGEHEPEGLFRAPFIAAILGALGIGPSQLVRFTEPTVLGEVLIPGPSYEESHKAHHIHVRLGAEIGSNLVGAPPGPRSHEPVFLSRASLREGVRRFVDEEYIVDRLERAGVTIVTPETLDLPDQIRVFERHPLVVAVLGSSLHTALLSRQPNNFVALQHQALFPSDYRMVDKLKSNTSLYLWAHGENRSTEVATTGFQVEFRLRNKTAVVDQLLRIIEARLAGRTYAA